MRVERAGFQFRMKLRSHEKFMFWKLYDFDEVASRIDSRKYHALGFDLRDIVSVHFIAMAMALGDFLRAVQL